MSYCKDYLRLICGAMEKALVSDASGKVIGIDKGLEIWADKVNDVRVSLDGLVFFCGNGASATMAEHMSHDWFQNGKVNTTTCSEVAHLTAISNDLGYDEVYRYRVKRILSERDILVGISSSGNSMNIVNAMQAAKENGAFTIGLSGRNEDNKVRGLADLSFYVPLETYGEIESAHALILHMALDYYMDKYLGGRH